MINIYSISSLIAVITCIFLGFFVYFKGRQKLENRLFALTSILIGIWCLYPFLTNIIPDNEKALFWTRIIYIAAVFTPSVFAHFGFTFSSYKKPILYFYIFSLILLFILPTPLFIRGITRLTFHTALKPGPFLHIFILFFGVACGWPIYKMFDIYKNSTGQKRNQFKYVFMGFAIAFIGGLVHFSPVYLGKDEPFPHDFLLIVFMIVISYAIIKYKTLEIDTVIHRTILWILTLLLLVVPMSLLVTFSKEEMASLNRATVLFIASTILIFFVWYYNKLKPFIDHLFRRRKYDYYRVLSEIGQKIGSELDINNVVSRLFKELKEVLYIRNGLILVQLPGQEDYTEAGSIGYDNILDSKKTEKATLKIKDSLVQWLQSHQKVLEREQVEIDPRYGAIKDVALTFLNQNSIEILIPVIMEHKVNALVGIGKKENLQAYTVTDVELLEKMGRQIGVTIDNALHHEDIVEKERLAEELRLGREIQQNLIPKVVPTVDGLNIEGLMLPAKEIGGDYYDYIKTLHKQGEGKLGIVIGDVSGKGVAAGLIMATAKATLKGLSQQNLTPREILCQANNVIYEYTGGQKFMTLLYFQYLEQERTFLYSSAGHEHILIYHSAINEVESIVSGGFMLGMMLNIETFLEEKQVKLNPKDKILLYTDGVTEAENERGDRFGLPRLKEAFQRYGTKPAQEFIQALKDEVYSFIGPHPQYDDITLVVMEAK